MKISVILPSYNEGQNLPRMVQVITDEIAGMAYQPELIVVDDGSTDNTWDVVTTLHKQQHISQALHLSRNFGKEAALAAGLDRATGDAVIIIDADFQHPPTLIRQMLTIWRDEDADVVEAVKNQRSQSSLFRKIGSKLFYMVFAIAIHAPAEEMTDFKLLDKKVVAEWKKLGETHLFFRGLISWLGFTHRKIFFEVPETVFRRSRWSSWKLIHYAINAITAFTTLPLFFAAITGGILSLLTLILWARYCYLTLINVPVNGIHVLLIAVLFVGSLILLSLGIIGLYLSQIYFEIKKRPRYVIDELHINS